MSVRLFKHQSTLLTAVVITLFGPLLTQAAPALQQLTPLTIPAQAHSLAIAKVAITKFSKIFSYDSHTLDAETWLLNTRNTVEEVMSPRIVFQGPIFKANGIDEFIAKTAAFRKKIAEQAQFVLYGDAKQIGMHATGDNELSVSWQFDVISQLKNSPSIDFASYAYVIQIDMDEEKISSTHIQPLAESTQKFKYLQKY